MNVREFPVLDDEDRAVVEELSVGLGDDEARVLAYLHRRRVASDVDDEPASLLAVRVGTGLNRNAAKTALATLADADLVETTTLPTEGRGRPPRGWRADTDRAPLRERVYAHRASTLLERAETVEDALDVADGSGGAGTVDRSASGRTRADSGSEFAGSERRESSESMPLTLSLNWRPNGLQAPFFAARAADAYAERGRPVEFVHRTGSDEALADVRDGSATVGVVGAVTLLRALDRGVQVVPLAVLYQRALAVLYTTRDAFGERFESGTQLGGRRVGMHVDSEIGLLGRLFLAQAGVTSAATVVDVAGEEERALREGRVDAVTGSFADPERLRDDGLAVDAIPVTDRFPIYGPAIVAGRDALDERRAALADVLVGTMTGYVRARRDPSEAAAAVAAAGDDAPDRVRRTFETAVDRFGTGADVAAEGWGAHRHEEWERLAEVLREVGLVPTEAG